MKKETYNKILIILVLLSFLLPAVLTGMLYVRVREFFIFPFLSLAPPLLGMAAGIYLLKYGSEHRKRVVKVYGIIIIAIFSLLILSSIRLWLLILGY